MRRERKIVGRYYRLSPKKRMDLIITNYDCFPAMCKDYERELSEWLKDSKEKARRAAIGDLGVRVQGGKSSSSVTEMCAIVNMEIERMMKECDLDSCENIEDFEEILRGVHELHLMQREYRNLRSKISTLHMKERESFIKYICREKRSAELSEQLEIDFDSVRKKMYRIKKKVYNGFVENLDDYDDNSILLIGVGGQFDE